ncbi:MAG: hypothetical protein SVR08_11920 [Spirochaetota bacterium]|nr:hypothetical protein [Spirochaetota bacterium]
MIKAEKRGIKACRLLNQYLSGEISLEDDKIKYLKIVVGHASRQSFFFFAKYVLGFNLLTERTHKRWADDLQSKFKKYTRFMRLKPRKTFKTTLYGEAFILWLWATVSDKLHIFYTSANSTLLAEVSAHLDHYLKVGNDSLYTFVFGIERDSKLTPNTTDTINIKGKDSSIKGSSLTFRTAGGSTNGIHPHVIIVDDPMDLSDRTSPATRRAKELWFDSLTPLLMEFDLGDQLFSLLMVIATRWHLADLISYILEKDSQKTNEEDKFNVEIESIYDENNEPMYPEFFGEDAIRVIRESISDVFFACQYLNRPLPEGLMVFDKNKMTFFDPEKLDLSKGRNLCLLDPSKGKIESDYPAVVWVNYQDNILSIFDAIDKLILIEKMLELIAHKNIYYNIQEMGYEDNGTVLLNKNIESAHAVIDPTYKIGVFGIHEGRNKNERIIEMQPNLHNGSVQFRSDYKKAYPEMMNQIIYYPVWEHDDYPDVVQKTVSYFIRPKFKFVRVGASGLEKL